ncbi:MAG: flagellar biosynthesis protein FlhF [Treponema sp.]|jgi:flagellar biosynthesis protein FlhF|nr:flagellar biosynthesis protein FlhF [Treponema sp.]
MECFVEQGEDYRDCMNKILAKYGDRVVPVRQRKIRIGGIFGIGAREGVEVEFYIPSYYSRTFSQPSSLRGQEPRLQAASAPAEVQARPETWTQAKPEHWNQMKVEPGNQAKPDAWDFEKQKERVIAAAGKDPTLQMVLREVRSIKEKIDAGENRNAGEEEHPSFTRLGELLEQNDFSPSYSRGIFERIRKECPLDTLDNFDDLEGKVLEWIGEGVKLYRAPERRPGRSRIFVLVGPTGVGKTTTVAKLAAAYGINGWDGEPLRVRMITVDGYRIAAREQIEKYGAIMGVPVAYAADSGELRKALSLFEAEADLVLVDTIGKSPRDAVKLGEMLESLSVCLSAGEAHLVLAATTKYSDMKDTMRRFAPFNYRSVIVTKLDETVRTGNVLSALADMDRPVSYITDGQSVEKHIHRADAVRFLVNLEGFRINRNRIEERFRNNGDTNGRSG